MSPCCANSHMLLPLRVFTLRTPLYTSLFLEAYIFSIIDTFLYERMFCKLTYVVPLRVLTLRTFLYTCISSQVYMYHIIDTLVYETQLCNTLRTFLFAYIYSKGNIYHVIHTFLYEPMLCEFTYVSAVASPHFQALCIQAHTYKNTYVIA